tara:strand:+ start:678 stop:1505 length:828 start_codon:yes stop_codon:yes gene_type:complete
MKSYRVKTQDQLSLHVQKWNKNVDTKASIFIVHGLGEHQNRYAHMAEFYCSNGFQVYSYDQRGHGKSEGKRGHSPGLQFNLNDLKDVLKTIRTKKLFLYGHSFGGNVLANFILRNKLLSFKGIILSAPWLKLSETPSLFDRILARTMNIFYPSFTKDKNIDPTSISTIRSSQELYKEDPLNHNRISARLFCEFFESGLWALKNAKMLKIKTLIVHGDKDDVISKNGSILFAKNSLGKAKYKIFKNTKHEIHNDITQKKLFLFVMKWMDKQLISLS